MLDVHRLRIFKAVVASGSVQAAAVNLGYTPSAVSQHVAALQRETGLTLLTRVGRGVQPTPAGLELAELAEPVLEQVAITEARLRDLREGRAGVLRMTYFDSVGQAWMPHVVRETVAHHPDLRIELVCDDVLPAAPEPGIDIHVAYSPAGYRPPAGYLAHRLLEEPFLACVPASHRLAHATVVDLAELRGEVWIDNDQGGPSRQLLLEACASAGFTPRYSIETQDHVTALKFVEVGVGLTVVPQLCLLAMPPSVHAVRLRNPEPTRVIWALVNTTVADQPAVHRALEVLGHCAAAES